MHSSRIFVQYASPQSAAAPALEPKRPRAAAAATAHSDRVCRELLLSRDGPTYRIDRALQVGLRAQCSRPIPIAYVLLGAHTHIAAVFGLSRHLEGQFSTGCSYDVRQIFKLVTYVLVCVAAAVRWQELVSARAPNCSARWPARPFPTAQEFHLCAAPHLHIPNLQMDFLGSGCTDRAGIKRRTQ